MAATLNTLEEFRLFVEAQLGETYRLGAEVPPSSWPLKDPSDVWDCSELVQVSYGKAGVTITDGAWLQYDATRAVSSPRVGDLVFKRNNPDRPNGIGHVGIITRVPSKGSPYIVEAKGKDFGVVMSRLSDWQASSTFAGIRRYPPFTARFPKEVATVAAKNKVGIVLYRPGLQSKLVAAMEALGVKFLAVDADTTVVERLNAPSANKL